jgi:hypothetical protein
MVFPYHVPFRESAATLEAESGYSLEAPEVSEFRQHILRGAWADAELLLVELGVTDTEALLVCISYRMTDMLLSL